MGPPSNNVLNYISENKCDENNLRIPCDDTEYIIYAHAAYVESCVLNIECQLCIMHKSVLNVNHVSLTRYRSNFRFNNNTGRAGVDIIA